MFCSLDLRWLLWMAVSAGMCPCRTSTQVSGTWCLTTEYLQVRRQREDHWKSDQSFLLGSSWNVKKPAVAVGKICMVSTFARQTNTLHKLILQFLKAIWGCISVAFTENASILKHLVDFNVFFCCVLPTIFSLISACLNPPEIPTTLQKSNQNKITYTRNPSKNLQKLSPKPSEILCRKQFAPFLYHPPPLELKIFS